MTRISPEQAAEYLQRWVIASAAERRELRETTIAVKLRQLAALMASAGVFADSSDRAQQEQEVCERWAKIRRAYGV